MIIALTPGGITPVLLFSLSNSFIIGSKKHSVFPDPVPVDTTRFFPAAAFLTALS
jgi:hypothetical protein